MSQPMPPATAHPLARPDLPCQCLYHLAQRAELAQEDPVPPQEPA